jgi:hypothetical protein
MFKSINALIDRRLSISIFDFFQTFIRNEFKTRITLQKKKEIFFN